MSHKIPNFPSTTGVLRRFICPKFVFGRGSAPDPAGGAHDAPPDPLVGWEGGYPLPIPHPPRRLRRLDLGVPNFISRKLATLRPPHPYSVTSLLYIAKQTSLLITVPYSVFGTCNIWPKQNSLRIPLAK